MDESGVNKDYLKEAKEIWKKISGLKKPKDQIFDSEKCRELLGVFQVGEYFYNIFNVAEGEIEYTSQGVQKLLGIEPDELDINLFFDRVHSEDVGQLVEFEKRTAEFLKVLPSDKILNYHSRYDYRMKNSAGKYIRVMQQAMPLQSDADGTVMRSLAVFTNISHLKRHGLPSLSIIGANGEPSYHEIESTTEFRMERDILSVREKEILFLISQGKNSTEIANSLNISDSTVTNHRKNILQKANCRSSAEVVAKAFKMGWI